MVTNDKAGVTPRVLNVPLLLQDGSASQLVHLSSNKDASTSDEGQLQKHSKVEGFQEDIKMGRAFSPIPLALVDSKAISTTFESLTSRENPPQKDETCIPIPTDVATKEVCAMASCTSFAPPKTAVPSIPNSPIKRPIQANSSMQPEAHFSTGFLGDKNKLVSKEQLTTIATPGTRQTKDIDLCNHSDRRCTLSMCYAPSNTRATSKESGSVNSSSSSCQSIVTSALRKLVKRVREQSQVRKASITSPSTPRELDHQKNSSQSLSLGKAGPREQRLPQKPQLMNSCSGLLSHQESDLQLRNGRQESHFMNAPSCLPSNNVNGLNKQLSPPQKSQFTNVSYGLLPRYSGSSPQKSQFANTSSTLPSPQTRVISNITASPSESHLSNTSLGVLSHHDSQEAQWSSTPSTPPSSQFIRVVPKASQRTDINSSLLLSQEKGVIQLPNVPQCSQPSNNLPSNPSREELGFHKPIARRQSQLANSAPTIPYSGDGSLYKPTTPTQSHFTEVLFSHPHREASSIYEKSSPQEPQVTKSSFTFADLKQKVNEQSSRQLTNTSSRLPSCQERNLGNRNPPVQIMSANCSMERRPNSNLISPSSQMSSPTETASFAPSSGASKCNEALQTPIPSNKLPSKEMRSIILKQVVSQSLRQRTHCNEHPSNSLSTQRCLPVALVQTMATHPNLHSDMSRNVAHQGPNENMNYVRPPLSSQGSSQDTSNDLKKGDRQGIKRVVFRNFPRSSSRNLFTVSQRNDVQRSHVNFTQTQHFNTGSSDGKDSFQAHLLETSHWNFREEEQTISNCYMDNNNSNNFSTEVMEMYSQSSIYTNSTEGRLHGYTDPSAELKKKSSFPNSKKAANSCSSRTAECDPRNSFHHEHCPLSQKSNLN